MKDVLWLIFEILINVYQGFMVTYFVYKLLTPKNSRYTKVAFCLCWVGIVTILTLMNYLTVFEGIGSFVYFAVLFLYALLMLNGNVVKKLVASILPLAIIFVISMGTLNFISSMDSISVSEIVVGRGVPRLTVLLSTQLLFYIVLRLALKMFAKTDDSFHASEWATVISVMTVSVILAGLLHAISINVVDKSQRMYINVAMLILIIINIFVFHMIDTLVKKNRLVQEIEILKLQERYQQQYIDNANLQYDSIKKIRHDLKNQFAAVYMLLSDGDVSSAMSYIEKTTHIINKASTVIKTNNSVVNAIVNSKMSVAAAMGIHISCMLVNDFDGIDQIDLCNLLGNALENAITANMAIKTKIDKFVSLRITEECGIYTFTARNAIDKPILTDNPNLKTTKADIEEHGYGTKIIKDIAQKYGGRCDFYEDGNVFCCKVILKSNNA